MDGEMVINKLDKYEETKNIPVIIISASTRVEDYQNLKEVCHGIIIKPVSRQQLVENFKKIFITSQNLENSQKINDIEQNFKVVTKKIKNITPNMKVRLTQLLEKLEYQQEILNQDLGKIRLISNLEILADKLENLAQEYEYQPLFDYSKKLFSDINEFNVEGIAKTLNGFPLLIEVLKIITR